MSGQIRAAVLPAVIALALLFLPVGAFAQTDTASIVGTVRDASAAVMPGVTITATETGTNVASTTVTNSSGEYVFPNLRIGTYTVAAELTGFRRAVRPAFQLNVQDRAEANFALEVGAVSEEVLVRAE